MQVSVLPPVPTPVVEMGNVRRANAAANKGSLVQTAASAHQELNAIEVSENFHNYYVRCWNSKSVFCVFFFGIDFNCKMFSAISEITKQKAKVSVETVAQQVTKEKGNVQEKAEQTLLQKKDLKKGSEAKPTDVKLKVTTTDKPVVKTQTKQDSSGKKTASKGSASVTKTSRPTITEVLLKHDGKKQKEVRKGKTTIMTSKKGVQKTDHKVIKEETAIKTHPKSDQLKDEPQTNTTKSNTKIYSSESKIVTILSKSVSMNKTKVGKATSEQSTLPEKNVTHSSGQKLEKKVSIETTADSSVDNRSNEASRTGEERVTQKSQSSTNATDAAPSSNALLQNKTTVHGYGIVKRIGGLGSVRVVNISSYSFTLAWSAPQGMFRNFTVVRVEPQTEGDGVDLEELEEEVLEADVISTAKTTTETQVQGKGTNTTAVFEKAAGSRSKAETKRISMVVPGNVRSVEFSNLRPNIAYVLEIHGATADRKSKTHRASAVTGNFPDKFDKHCFRMQTGVNECNQYENNELHTCFVVLCISPNQVLSLPQRWSLAT